MSLAQILGHLRTGDVIIVRDNDPSLRLRFAAGPDRGGAAGANTFDSRKLLRKLIIARKDGGKK